MKKVLMFFAVFSLLAAGVLAAQYNGRYDDYDSYFNDKYNTYQDRYVPIDPGMYRNQYYQNDYSRSAYGQYDYRKYDYGQYDPDYGQYDSQYGYQGDFGYGQNYQQHYGPITQKSYFRIPEPAVQVKKNTYEDGYNKGYFIGYNDGLNFQRYGLEGYTDYRTMFDLKTSDTTRTGYYSFNGNQVSITARKVVNEYDKGYNAGVLSGFRDGFYDLEYRGLNPDYYAYQIYQEKHPAPRVQVQQFPQYRYPAFQSFPGYSSYTQGRYLYGFSYYK